MTFRSLLSAGSLSVLLVACATAAPAGAPPAPASSGVRAYVANQTAATISVIDASRDSVIATVDLQSLGFSANAKPHHIAVEPDGSAWYVSLIGDGLVVKFDRDNHVVGKAAMKVPGLLYLDAAHDRLYASRSMSAVNPPSSIGVIRRSDMALLEELDVLVPRPHAITASPDGSHVFVGSLGRNDIAVVDTRSDNVNIVPVDGPTHVFVQFAMSPDGTRMVATAQLTGKLLVFDATRPDSLPLIHSVDVAAWPWHVLFTPDGRYVWFPNQHGGGATEVDAQTWQVAGMVTGDGFADPHGIAISPDGRQVFVSNHGKAGTTPSGNMQDMHNDQGERESGSVVVIDARNRTIKKVLQTGRYSAGMGIGGGR